MPRLAGHDRRPSRRISLALQGGGAHGAFTWGVLNALLADPRVPFEGLCLSGLPALIDGAATYRHASTDSVEQF